MMRKKATADLSLLTIAAGREEHLRNLLKGVAASSTLPAEMVIVLMGDNPRPSLSDLDLPFQLSQRTIEGSSDALPLAAARNLAAHTAGYEDLVFLDVDCIPDRDFIDHHVNAIKHSDQLWMGTVRYLQPGWNTRNLDTQYLEENSDLNPIQPDLQSGALQDRSDHNLFWSLNFSISKKLFEKIGGFDEDFVGYGGEDTDFAYQARHLAIPFGHVGAQCFHQYHPTKSPPTQHLEPIVKNAKIFHRKWGVWPMRGWLNQFAQIGLVHFDPEENRLDIR